ncbi:MAG: PD-(D/E)XK nuclease family protein [Pseudomonadales bacterium]|nr:PD-(D/E)XK nuclease family protein [Pseudomonadales bacterium]
MTDAGALILTPTARLARSAALRHAEQQATAARAWLAPRILSFPAWLADLRTHYFLMADDRRIPIDSGQARVLWQGLIDRDVFVGEPEVAELAERAWRRIHEFALPLPETWPVLHLSEDNRRFREWAGRYRRTCTERGLVDEWAFAAELPELIRTGAITAPAHITLLGFDLEMTPLQQRVLAALRDAGSTLTYPSDDPGNPGEPVLVRIQHPEDELAAAARWAREHLRGAPDARIAVVVPDLTARLAMAARAFQQVMDPPAYRLMDAGPPPWHISLGESLPDWPLVRDALAALALSDREITQPEAARLLRSPFLAGWDLEHAQRARALARLTADAPYTVTPAELVRLTREADAIQLAARLEHWLDARRAHADATQPSVWAARFQTELGAAGFGRGRTLDSREYQVLGRWHELLESFSAMDLATERPVSRDAALDLLRERAAAAVFREQNPGAPIEILGVEEALGARFDAVWLTSLDSETWPLPARRDPLIPRALQEHLPGATAAGALTLARRQLVLLAGRAPVVIGSYTIGSGDEPRQPTALLRFAGIVAHDDLAALAAPPWHAAAMAPVQDDARAPPLVQTDTGGGTTLLRHQSACPFRAFAERRLGAIDLRTPRPGLDAAQRGTIIHRALEAFWDGLEGRQALRQLDDTVRRQRVDAAVERALERFTARYRLLLSPRGRELEHRRTALVVERWLALEAEREDFAVLGHEHKIRMTFAGLSLEGKIDRIDRLPDGGSLLIDYKTGMARKGDWAPEQRIVDPQLPAYAVTVEPPPDGIAFARIRPERLEFAGIAAHVTGTPGITRLADDGRNFPDHDDWPRLLATWRAVLDALAEDFQAGFAEVNPRRPGECARCHLHALCRIRERAGAAQDTGSWTSPWNDAGRAAGGDAEDG